MFLQIFRSINEKATDYGKWALVSIGMIQEEKKNETNIWILSSSSCKFLKKIIVFFFRMHTDLIYLFLISEDKQQE